MPFQDGWHGYGTLLEILGIEHGHHFKEWKSVGGITQTTWNDSGKITDHGNVKREATRVSLGKRTPYEHCMQEDPRLSWHYIVVRGMLCTEPGWKEDELKALPVLD